jgi:hypothetical protein
MSVLIVPARVDQYSFFGRKCKKCVEFELVEFIRDLPDAEVGDLLVFHGFFFR